MYINDDPRVVAAIEAAERWLLNPSKANKSAAGDAAGAAACAAANADGAAAYAAGDAACAAAYAAANDAGAAAYAAAYAAGDAAYAADGNISLTEHDLLQIYINEQILYAVNS